MARTREPKLRKITDVKISNGTVDVVDDFVTTLGNKTEIRSRTGVGRTNLVNIAKAIADPTNSDTSLNRFTVAQFMILIDMVNEAVADPSLLKKGGHPLAARPISARKQAENFASADDSRISVAEIAKEAIAQDKKRNTNVDNKSEESEDSAD